jgi:hypothetical protein
MTNNEPNYLVELHKVGEKPVQFKVHAASAAQAKRQVKEQVAAERKKPYEGYEVSGAWPI